MGSHLSTEIVKAIEAVPSASATTETGRCRIAEGGHLHWWPVVDKYHEAPGVEHLAAFWLREAGSTKPAIGKMEVWLGKNVDLQTSEQGQQEVLCPLYPKNLQELFKAFYEQDGHPRELVSPCPTPAPSPAASTEAPTFGADGSFDLEKLNPTMKPRLK